MKDLDTYKRSRRKRDAWTDTRIDERAQLQIDNRIKEFRKRRLEVQTHIWIIQQEKDLFLKWVDGHTGRETSWRGDGAGHFEAEPQSRRRKRYFLSILK